MQIEIRDPELEARIQEQLRASGSKSVEDVLRRLLETQEEQDRWLLENKPGAACFAPSAKRAGLDSNPRTMREG